MPKLISEDENFYNVMRDDGTEWNIAKKGIDPSRADYFTGLPKYEAPRPELPSAINKENVARVEQGLEPYSREELGQMQAQGMAVADQTPMLASTMSDVNVVTPQINETAFVAPEVQDEQVATQETPLEKFTRSQEAIAAGEVAGQEKTSKEYDQLIKERERLDYKFAQDRKDLEQKQIEAEQHYKEVSDDYFNSKEIDQGRYWKNASTGQKILAGIGLALASLNPQAMQVALSSINRAVDRDIDAQKLEILKKKEKVGEAKSLVGDFYRRFGDLDKASNAAKMASLEKAKMRIEQIAGQTKSSVIKAKAQQAIAQVEMEIQKQKGLFDQRTLASKKKEQEDARTKNQRFSNIRTEISQLQNLISKKGTFEVLGSHENELRQKIDSIAIDAAKLFDPQSVARESEVAAFRKMLFEPGFTVRNQTAKDTLKSFQEMLQRRYQNEIGKEKYSEVGFRPE